MKNQSTVKPGCYLPSITVNEKDIYELLSKTHWTLIVCGKEKIKMNQPQLKILHLPEGAYSLRYILIKPDWHIVLSDNLLNESEIMKLII
ncbi:MAG: hypothetical protein Q8L78_09240 [Coxiellaceae bacterium]|nr:hypothetical protein [Coxiellaceae bacterium]